MTPRGGLLVGGQGNRALELAATEDAVRPDTILAVFIPGKVQNPLNGSHGHWSKRARWAKTRREKAQMCILVAIRNSIKRFADPAMPKLVTFTATVWNEFDSDGLAAALKPTRDALVDMRVLHNDRPSSGHAFIYEQVVARGKKSEPGVAIRVEKLL